MRIHCIGMVKDEADVLTFTLDSAVRWADTIHICDNGSTDGTYELLQDYAARHPAVVSVARTTEPFTEDLRVETARPVFHRASKGDWWCRLDADEIYVDDPRDFLARVGPRYGRVQSASLQFYLTEEDAARYMNGGGAWTPGQSRHYLMNWSETRFVRHQEGVPWSYGWPSNVGTLRVAPDRIRLLHYQYRTPDQVNRRLRARIGKFAFRHEVAKDWQPRGFSAADIVPSGPIDSPDDLWKTRVVRSGALERYDPQRPPPLNEELLPPVPAPPPLTRRVWGALRRGMRPLLVGTTGRNSGGGEGRATLPSAAARH